MSNDGANMNIRNQDNNCTRTRIPVLRPSLPDANRLLPYLRRIDQNRVYSNFGPLSLELGQRLADRFQVNAEKVVCANSGTTALATAILAITGRATSRRPLAIVPSFTFAATALAAEICGFEVIFSDVSAESWGLEADKLASFPNLDRVGVVVPVAPFGRPVEQNAWRNFQETTGVPVVIDAAACFETVAHSPHKYMGRIPVAMSFHATKSFSCGEGGCVVVDDEELANRVTQCLNFGFFRARECEYPSMNGKMSEYHAAVGLAELDHWTEKATAMNRVSQIYRENFSRRGIGHKLVSAPEICSSYVLFVSTTETEAISIQSNLESSSIGFRHWYGALHRQKYFSREPAQNLPVSENLSKRILGLPVAPDLDRDSISFVCETMDTGT